MFIFFTRQAKGTTGQVEDSKDILVGRYDPNALKVNGLHDISSFLLFLSNIRIVISGLFLMLVET